MSKRRRLTRAAELDSLAHFRKSIEQCCAELGIDEETAYDLQLAADEACTNVIQHGYAGMNPGSIILEIIPADDEITMRITDFGHPFEPSTAPMPDTNAPLEERAEGGFGLFFIYETMDDVDYVSNEEGNTLILKRRLQQ